MQIVDDGPEHKKAILLKLKHVIERVDNIPRTIFDQIKILAEKNLQLFENDEIYETLKTMLFSKASSGKSSGKSELSSFAALTMFKLKESSISWPLEYLQFYLDDALYGRLWVDSPDMMRFCKDLVSWANVYRSSSMNVEKVSVRPTRYDTDEHPPSTATSPNDIEHDSSGDEEVLLSHSTTDPTLTCSNQAYQPVRNRFSSQLTQAENITYEAISSRLSGMDAHRQSHGSTGLAAVIKTTHSFCTLPLVRSLAVKHLEGWIHNPVVSDIVKSLIREIVVSIHKATANNRGGKLYPATVSADDSAALTTIVTLGLTVSTSHGEACRSAVVYISRYNHILGLFFVSLLFKELVSERTVRSEVFRLMLNVLGQVDEANGGGGAGGSNAVDENHILVNDIVKGSSSFLMLGKVISAEVLRYFTVVDGGDGAGLIPPPPWHPILELCCRILKQLTITRPEEDTISFLAASLVPQTQLCECYGSRRHGWVEMLHLFADLTVACQLRLSHEFLKLKADLQVLRADINRGAAPEGGSGSGAESLLPGGTKATAGRGGAAAGPAAVRGRGLNLNIAGSSLFRGRGGFGVSKGRGGGGATASTNTNVAGQAARSNSVWSAADGSGSLSREADALGVQETGLSMEMKQQQAKGIERRMGDLQRASAAVQVHFLGWACDLVSGMRRQYGRAAISALVSVSGSGSKGEEVEEGYCGTGVGTASIEQHVLPLLQRVLCLLPHPIQRVLGLMEVDKGAASVCREAGSLSLKLVTVVGDMAVQYADTVRDMLVAVDLLIALFKRAMATEWMDGKGGTGVLVNEIEVIPALYRLSRLQPLGERLDDVLNLPSMDMCHVIGPAVAPVEATVQSDVPIGDGNCKITVEIARQTIGYAPLASRTIFWRVSSLCFGLGCSRPSTLGRYMWENMPTIRALMLMAISGRFYYPTVGDGSTAPIAGGCPPEPQAVSPPCFNHAQRFSLSASIPHLLVETQECLCVAQGHVDELERTVRGYEEYTWTRLFADPLPLKFLTPSTSEEVGDADENLAAKEESPVRGTAGLRSGRKRVRRLSEKKQKSGEAEDASNSWRAQGASLSSRTRSGRVVKHRFNVTDLFHAEKTQDQMLDEEEEELLEGTGEMEVEEEEDTNGEDAKVSMSVSPYPETQESLCPDSGQVSARGRRAFLGEGVGLERAREGGERTVVMDEEEWTGDIEDVEEGNGTSDESSGDALVDTDSDPEFELPKLLKRRRGKRTVGGKQAVKRKRGRPVKAVVEMNKDIILPPAPVSTQYGAVPMDDLMFLCVWLLPRSPPEDVIVTVKALDKKYGFGRTLRACKDPDFIVQAMSGDPTSNNGIASEESIRDCSSWVLPAISSELNGILSRIPENVIEHLFLILSGKLSEHISCYDLWNRGTVLRRQIDSHHPAPTLSVQELIESAGSDCEAGVDALIHYIVNGEEFSSTLRLWTAVAVKIVQSLVDPTIISFEFDDEKRAVLVDENRTLKNPDSYSHSQSLGTDNSPTTRSQHQPLLALFAALHADSPARRLSGQCGLALLHYLLKNGTTNRPVELTVTNICYSILLENSRLSLGDAFVEALTRSKQSVHVRVTDLRHSLLRALLVEDRMDVVHSYVLALSRKEMTSHSPPGAELSSSCDFIPEIIILSRRPLLAAELLSSSLLRPHYVSVLSTLIRSERVQIPQIDSVIQNCNSCLTSDDGSPDSTEDTDWIRALLISYLHLFARPICYTEVDCNHEDHAKAAVLDLKPKLTILVTYLVGRISWRSENFGGQDVAVNLCHVSDETSARDVLLNSNISISSLVDLYSASDTHSAVFLRTVLELLEQRDRDGRMTGHDPESPPEVVHKLKLDITAALSLLETVSEVTSTPALSESILHSLLSPPPNNEVAQVGERLREGFIGDLGQKNRTALISEIQQEVSELYIPDFFRNDDAPTREEENDLDAILAELSQVLSKRCGGSWAKDASQDYSIAAAVLSAMEEEYANGLASYMMNWIWEDMLDISTERQGTLMLAVALERPGTLLKLFEEPTLSRYVTESSALASMLLTLIPPLLSELIDSGNTWAPRMTPVLFPQKTQAVFESMSRNVLSVLCGNQDNSGSLVVCYGTPFFSSRSPTSRFPIVCSAAELLESAVTDLEHLVRQDERFAAAFVASALDVFSKELVKSGFILLTSSGADGSNAEEGDSPLLAEIRMLLALSYETHPDIVLETVISCFMSSNKNGELDTWSTLKPNVALSLFHALIISTNISSRSNPCDKSDGWVGASNTSHARSGMRWKQNSCSLCRRPLRYKGFGLTPGGQNSGGGAPTTAASHPTVSISTYSEGYCSCSRCDWRAQRFCGLDDMVSAAWKALRADTEAQSLFRTRSMDSTPECDMWWDGVEGVEENRSTSLPNTATGIEACKDEALDLLVGVAKHHPSLWLRYLPAWLVELREDFENSSNISVLHQGENRGPPPTFSSVSAVAGSPFVDRQRSNSMSSDHSGVYDLSYYPLDASSSTLYSDTFDRIEIHLRGLVLRRTAQWTGILRCLEALPSSLLALLCRPPSLLKQLVQLVCEIGTRREGVHRNKALKYAGMHEEIDSTFRAFENTWGERLAEGNATRSRFRELGESASEY